jgi:hypothetical protein
VIQRSVDVGQTVAASLSSPTLFMIVGDLGNQLHWCPVEIDNARFGRNGAAGQMLAAQPEWRNHPLRREDPDTGSIPRAPYLCWLRR